MHKLLRPHLVVNPNAVVEVTPLVGAKCDLQSVGEAWDESTLEGKTDGTSDGIFINRSDCGNREAGQGNSGLQQVDK